MLRTFAQSVGSVHGSLVMTLSAIGWMVYIVGLIVGIVEMFVSVVFLNGARFLYVPFFGAFKNNL
jgi:glucokinase